MRGKTHSLAAPKVQRRITPAYAGKNSNQLVPLFKPQDHPRLCGEKPVKCSLKNPVTGSPPPMRGKICTSGITYKVPRITPAYAGKKLPDTERGTATRDHPRLCGEKLQDIFQPVPSAGSPPPMRGKIFDHGKNQFDVGITPAYAGKNLFGGM